MIAKIKKIRKKREKSRVYDNQLDRPIPRDEVTNGM